MTPAGPDTSHRDRPVSGERPSGTTFAARGDDEIVVTRTVNAVRDLVFAAWTEPAHLRRWMGRADWTMTVCESDPRPGGVRRFTWRRHDGAEMGVRGVYLELTPPTGFVWTESFDGTPTVTVNTLHLVEHDGRTTITSTIRCPDAGVRDTILATSMAGGFDESLIRLSEYLSLDPRGRSHPSPTADAHPERNLTWT